MHPPLLPLVLFVLTYAGLALGSIPGLALDRTGFALLGAMAFIASGQIDIAEAKSAVDAPTLVVLFGMMLLSAQYRMSGPYAAIGRRLAHLRDPRALLAGILLASALLSAVLTNDVICFALTPLLATALLTSGRNPLPYLIALATASNIGSALTPIGNPQNILIAQSLHLPFVPFVRACIVPVVLSLAALYLLLARTVRADSASLPQRAAPASAGDEPPLQTREAAKAVLLTLATIALFLSPVPPALTALGVAGVVLTSRRMHTRDVLALVDWHLLALFIGLFVVGRGLALSGWTVYARTGLLGLGVDVSHPVALALAVALLGLLVGNVPAVMVLLPLVPGTPANGHLLALASTFAGNTVLVGSLANLIVVEQAARCGIKIGLREHLRYALPTALLSLGFAAASLAWLR